MFKNNPCCCFTVSRVQKPFVEGETSIIQAGFNDNSLRIGNHNTNNKSNIFLLTCKHVKVYI